MHAPNFVLQAAKSAVLPAYAVASAGRPTARSANPSVFPGPAGQATCETAGKAACDTGLRLAPALLLAVLLSGCSQDDARLHGTWHSNRDATVAAAFERDPGWTNATPEKVERFRNVFGHMTITYASGRMTSDYRGEVGSFPYHVLQSGSNFVVIRSDAPLEKERDIRIRFVDGDSAYWVDTGPLGNGLEERFDRVKQ